jgi:hypothetical protein
MSTLRLGSREHRDLFCGAFVATHRTYEPERLPWPVLGADALARLRSLPFWGEALATERETGAKITAYADTVDDPVLQAALALQGREELRHAELLETLTTRYEIPVVPRRVMPLSENLHQAFVDAGYGECIDSFFAFGLFAVARRSGFFPEPLLTVVEPILEEEARHIVFFANWEAYTQIEDGRGPRALRAGRALRYYVRAVRRRLGAFKGVTGGSGFTASGATDVAIDLTPEGFLQTCLRENTRRLLSFEPGLLRPRLVPALARLTLRALRLVRSHPHSDGTAASARRQ